MVDGLTKSTLRKSERKSVVDTWTGDASRTCVTNMCHSARRYVCNNKNRFMTFERECEVERIINISSSSTYHHHQHIIIINISSSSTYHHHQHIAPTTTKHHEPIPPQTPFQNFSESILWAIASSCVKGTLKKSERESEVEYVHDICTGWDVPRVFTTRWLDHSRKQCDSRALGRSDTCSYCHGSSWVTLRRCA